MEHVDYRVMAEHCVTAAQAEPFQAQSVVASNAGVWSAKLHSDSVLMREQSNYVLAL